MSPHGNPARRSLYKSQAYQKKLAQLYKEYKEAYEQSSSCKSSDDMKDMEDAKSGAQTVNSAHWWPGKCFTHEEIRSPPMTSKKLRTLGFLSHSNLPKVDGELQPLEDDRASKTIANWATDGRPNEGRLRSRSVKSSAKKQNYSRATSPESKTINVERLSVPDATESELEVNETPSVHSAKVALVLKQGSE